MGITSMAALYSPTIGFLNAVWISWFMRQYGGPKYFLIASYKTLPNHQQLVCCVFALFNLVHATLHLGLSVSLYVSPKYF